MKNKIFNISIIVLLIVSLGLNGFLFFKTNKISKTLEGNEVEIRNEIELQNSKIESIKTFSESLSKWFDINTVESVVSNTRAGFESGFQSIKSYLVELNKEVKTLKENQAILLTKIQNYETLLSWFKEEDNIKREFQGVKALIDSSANGTKGFSDAINTINLKLKEIENRLLRANF